MLVAILVFSAFFCVDCFLPSVVMVRTQEEMAHTCRGTINLAGALIDTIDSHNFAISNGGTQVYYLRASSEVERNRWVTALELAKAKARKTLDGGKTKRSCTLCNECTLQQVI